MAKAIAKHGKAEVPAGIYKAYKQLKNLSRKARYLYDGHSAGMAYASVADLAAAQKYGNQIVKWFDAAYPDAAEGAGSSIGNF